ncbi:MAG: hypothetical protein K2Y14_11025 [Burkholderiales bacterium]|nr:hypothetical protein [Burkholderiales bacterium]
MKKLFTFIFGISYSIANAGGISTSTSALEATLQQQQTNPSINVAATFGVMDINPFQGNLNTSQRSNINNAFSENNELKLKDKILKLKSTSKFITYCSNNLKIKYDDNQKYCSNTIMILAYDKYKINGFQMQVDIVDFLKTIPSSNKINMQYIKILESFNVELDSLFGRTSIKTN